MLTSGEVDKINRAAQMLRVELPNKRPTEEEAWWLARDALNYALTQAQLAKSPKKKAQWALCYQRCRALLAPGRN